MLARWSSGVAKGCIAAYIADSFSMLKRNLRFWPARMSW